MLRMALAPAEHLHAERRGIRSWAHVDSRLSGRLDQQQ
jgi:hypothetical protein